MTALLLVVALQGPVLDHATLVVRQGTAETAREDFRLAAGRPGTGAAGGWTLTTTVRYDGQRPVVVLAPILEIDRDSSVVAMQYDVADPREPMRILGQAGRGRFTVRFLTRHTERAREFPAGSRTVVLDDSVYAPYLLAAWHARAAAVTLRAVVPRALRQETLVVQALGPASTTLNHETVTLTHVTVQGGPNQTVHVWLDPRGRLMKVEIPSRQVTVERIPEG